MLSAQTGTHLALGTGSADRGLGGLRAVRFRDGRRIIRPERGRKKKKEGLTSWERGFEIARQHGTQDRSSLQKTQRNTGKHRETQETLRIKLPVMTRLNESDGIFSYRRGDVTLQFATNNRSLHGVGDIVIGGA